MMLQRNYFLCLCGATCCVFLYVMMSSITTTPKYQITKKVLATSSEISSDPKIPRESVDNDLPLMTLFTSFKDSPDSVNIYANTILNWAQFLPDIQPVLYARDSSQLSNETLITTAMKNGWKVYFTPNISSDGIPLFKYMCLDIQNRVRSKLYGYADGDILFEKGLSATLKSLSVIFSDTLSETSVAVGLRTNVIVDYKNSYSLHKFEDVMARAKTSGSLVLSTSSFAYFFFTNLRNYPWQDFKDVAVGTSRMDTYVVAYSLLNNVTVVDVTRTVLALHQSGAEGLRFASGLSSFSQYSVKVIGNFNYEMGDIANTHYITEFQGNIVNILQKKSNTFNIHYK